MAIKTVKAQLEALLGGVPVEGLSFEELELTYDEATGYYVTTITAPNMSSYNLDDQIFDVNITATTVGGNVDSIDKTDETFGEDCRLRVYER